jgi:hypothetical protein
MNVTTADGVQVRPGMTIYVLDSGVILTRIVNRTEGKFRIFYEPTGEPDECLGCRSTVAYSTAEAALEAHQSSFIRPELDRDDSRIIRLALAAKLSETKSLFCILRAFAKT